MRFAMEPTERTNSDWTDCQPGEVQRLVQGLPATRRARTIERRAATVAVLLLVGFTGVWFANGQSQSEPSYGGIVCSQVVQKSREFLAKTLNAKTADQINVHLGHCEACSKLVNNMRQNEQPNGRPETRNQAMPPANRKITLRSKLTHSPSLAGL
jgi:hypothetical protein